MTKRSILRYLLSVGSIILGFAICIWGAFGLLSDSFDGFAFANKYSSEGQNGEAVILSMLIGGTCVCFGAFEILLLRGRRKRLGNNPKK